MKNKSILLTYSILALGAHRWRDHVWRQRCGRVLPRLLPLDQPHRQRKLFRIQLALLINITQIPENWKKSWNPPKLLILGHDQPYVCKDVLWQSSLEEDVLDLDAADESIPVSVRLPEQRHVAQLLAGVHHPRDGLDGGGPFSFLTDLRLKIHRIVVIACINVNEWIAWLWQWHWHLL